MPQKTNRQLLPSQPKIQQQKQIKVRSLSELLKKKGVDLDDEDKIGDQLEN